MRPRTPLGRTLRGVSIDVVVPFVIVTVLGICTAILFGVWIAVCGVAGAALAVLAERWLTR